MKTCAIVSYAIVVIVAAGCTAQGPEGGEGEDAAQGVQYLNPAGLHRNPAFSQVVVTEGYGRTVYVGGQNSVSSSGVIVGQGDIKAQAEQIFKNLDAALAAGGATLENVVKWNIYIVEGQSLDSAFEVFQSVWGKRPDPPAITVVSVSGLADDEFLMEIDAIAVVPVK